jgi:hypothetical protein
MKCAIYLEDNNPINVFSANAIRAGQGIHDYEIIYDTNLFSSFDDVIKFRKQFVVTDARSFLKIIEPSLGVNTIDTEFLENIKPGPSVELNFNNSVMPYELYTTWSKTQLTQKGFWGYNSEDLNLPKNTFSGIVCVASGLIPLMLIDKITTVDNVVITDINENCLSFQEHLIKNIDTIKTVDQYIEFVNAFSKDNGLEIYGTLTNKDTVQNLLDSIQTKLSFLKSLSITYYKGDLRLPDQFIRDTIKSSKAPLVYFSNIFSFVPTLENNNSEKDFVLFINILLGSNLNTTWHGDTYERYKTSNIVSQSTDFYHKKLNINLPYQGFLNEIEALEERNLFTIHRDRDGHKGTYFNHGWSSFVLHGLGYNKTHGYEQYGYKTDEESPYDWTLEALENCPKMVEWFKEMKFKNRYHRVRLMKLAPGGMVGLHNDNPNPTASATNMAVNNPVNCEMHFLNRKYQYLGIVPWQAGDVYKILIGLNHYVINKSNENRYHFIIHGAGGYI